MKKKNKKQKDKIKTRNWLALHAKGLTGRRGAGAHGSNKYKRNKKHKKQQED